MIDLRACLGRIRLGRASATSLPRCWPSAGNAAGIRYSVARLPRSPTPSQIKAAVVRLALVVALCISWTKSRPATLSQACTTTEKPACCSCQAIHSAQARSALV
jgi:hypothetical protein